MRGRGKLSNPYLYNDKEMLDEDAGLNWYDYGFRNYDPQIGRFMQLDPLTDDYPELTPYQYASNDPVTNIDVDGLGPGDPISDACSIGRDFTYGSSAVNSAMNYVTPLFRTIGSSASSVNKASSVFGIFEKISSIVIHSAIIAGNIINSNTTTQPAGSPVIARSKNRLNQEDTKENDGNPNTFGKEGKFYAESDDDVALADMRKLINAGTVFADARMRSVAIQMYDQFKSKKGGDFHSPDLDNEIKDDERFKMFVQIFKLRFEGVLANNGGDIKSLINSPISIQDIVPTFNDNATGLGITVDALNYTCIVLRKFTIAPDGKYVASIQVQMYDSFGLDTKDVNNFGRNNVFKRVTFKLGFIAWWILQHVKGYKHLDTQIYINETLSGTIRK